MPVAALKNIAKKRLGTISQEALKNGVNERRKKKRNSKKAKIPQMI